MPAGLPQIKNAHSSDPDLCPLPPVSPWVCPVFLWAPLSRPCPQSPWWVSPPNPEQMEGGERTDFGQLQVSRLDVVFSLKSVAKDGDSTPQATGDPWRVVLGFGLRTSPGALLAPAHRGGPEAEHRGSAGALGDHGCRWGGGSEVSSRGKAGEPGGTCCFRASAHGSARPRVQANPGDGVGSSPAHSRGPDRPTLGGAAAEAQ